MSHCAARLTVLPDSLCCLTRANSICPLADSRTAHWRPPTAAPGFLSVRLTEDTVRLAGPLSRAWRDAQQPEKKQPHILTFPNDTGHVRRIISAATLPAHMERTLTPMSALNSTDNVTSTAVMSAPVRCEHWELSADVASRPRLDMREIVRHLGMVQLRTAANWALPEQDWLDVNNFPDLVGHRPDLVGYWPKLAAGPPEDADPVDWYRDILARLIDVLKPGPADLERVSSIPAL